MAKSSEIDQIVENIKSLFPEGAAPTAPSPIPGPRPSISLVQEKIREVIRLLTKIDNELSMEE